MNLTDVIETLVDERNLDREQVVEVVREGITTAYSKKYPEIEFVVKYNNHSGEMDVFVEKEVVTTINDTAYEINVRKARTIKPDAQVGDLVMEPFAEPVGRIEMLAAKQYIATGIRQLEQQGVYNEFKEKEGEIVNGRVHKRERAGFVVKMGEAMAFLPNSCSIPGETLRVGYPVRALLKEVLPASRGDHQLILDRASSDFVKKLLELEIPEVFEGMVEIKDVVRTSGYKSKVVVLSNSKEIDPVGTCVGVGGVRIRPILKELGQEKVDLIEYTDDIETLVATALKPAEIDKATVNEAEKSATVWLAQDQRSFAIGKQGQNIALVSRLTGLHVQLQEEVRQDTNLHSAGLGQDLEADQAVAEQDIAEQALAEQALAEQAESPAKQEAVAESPEEPMQDAAQGDEE